MMKNQIPKIETPEFKLQRVYTKAGVHPFDMVMWEKRDSVIMNAQGKKVFEQKDVEVPSFWSQTATNIAASKYFRGKLGTPERETSVKQMINRVVTTIVEHGKKEGYFANLEEASIFQDELTYILLNQIAAFNSPVWFNFGVEKKPQGSACFINSVEDDMRSILQLAVTEGMLFKYGSGAGVNLSVLRSSKEYLSSGGKASGPVSFMKGYDAFAGVIKSGGKTRRAAKMVILNVDHPDIREFIWCKAKEERKAKDLIRLGYDGSLDGEVYSNIFFQNANNSVRVTDEFMQAVKDGKTYKTRYVLTGKECEELDARTIMKEISEATWECGDPGIQFDTTINKWHTCKASGRINASNPCVTGDTRVLVDGGRWIRIDKLVDKKTNIIVNNGLIASVPIKGSFETGIKPVYRLRTKSGYEIKLTGDHKVYTVNRGFVPAVELTKDDLVLLPGQVVSEIKEPSEEDKTFYQMLGVYLADGCFNKKDTIVLTMGENENKVLEKFATYLSTLERITHKKSSATVQIHGNVGRLNISNKRIVDKFSKFLDLTKYSHEKIISDEILELSLGEQKYVLQGLFTADGTVANYGEKSQYISLDSTSLELLKGVQLMLLGFGIKSKLYLNRRAGKDKALLPDGKGGLKEYVVKEMHSLRISRSSRHLFEQLIGFMPESDKARKLAEMNKEVSSYNDVPYDYVESLTYFGMERVYDLTEPITHTFVANGITIHNCSEFMFIDNSACNLASINLLKFLDPETGRYDVEKFKHTVAIMIIAQEIIVGLSSYPTPEIEKNSHDFRPLGLGYANLGALLMAAGLPYDSDEGRNFAAAISSVMTGYGYYVSAWLAKKMGAFKYYSLNKDSMLEVIRMHLEAAEKIGENGVPNYLLKAAREVWQHAFASGSIYGYRNAQISALAPTGTIGFLMDCDTTGIEPDMALIKYKWLVGGGMMKIVNSTIPIALKKLGYSEQQVSDILHYIDENETIEGAPHLKEEHLPVFDCAFKPAKGKRFISYMGHIKMMAAVQPFISGAISKTVNMPKESTVDDIYNAYVTSWELGLKAIAIYRDGSKGVQPVTITKEVKEVDSISAAKVEVKEVVKEVVREVVVNKPSRRKLPDERKSITHKFSISGHEGYITVGLYEDGQPGEIFITMSKEGSSISGLMDAFATSISIALQYGVPLKTLVKKFVHMRFEPSGYTSHPNIRYAKSLMDYIFRWMALKFLSKEDQIEVGLNFEYEETITNYLSQGEEKEDKIETSAVKASTEPGSGLIDPSVPVGSPPGNVNERKEIAPVELAVENKESREKKNSKIAFENSEDAPACAFCGAIMVRNGSCYKCLNCGATSGCS
jgi:ribonucleoside-diphosphate reductase alpha chain